jgi:L-rhamnose isomerase
LGRESFRRLEWAVGVIARHPDYPGKAETLQRCREDIERRLRLGMLTDAQRIRLHSILDGEDARG